MISLWFSVLSNKLDVDIVLESHMDESRLRSS